MLIRLALLFSILLVAASLVLFLLTRNPRYIGFAWQVLRLMTYILLVFGALFLLERYGLAVWQVLL
jgi:hypothetical protein